MAWANCGNVRERYFPRLAWTNTLGLGWISSGMMGGRFRSQYRVFLVYLTPNQDGWTKHDGRGNCARAIGSGFSTATYGALALRHLKKNARAWSIF